MTFYNQLTYNNATPKHRSTPMTTTATLPLVLDFDLITTKRGVRWNVFDARSGADLTNGSAPTRELATAAALGAIADRTPHRLYVIRHANRWCARIRNEWVPLPLTPVATTSDAHAYATNMIAKGRQVEVCEVARLACSFN